MTQLSVPEGMLRISWYLPETECLGPGKRFAIWVQGCRQRCEGCIAQRLQDTEGGVLVPVAKLTDAVLQTSGLEGLSISGGEPFLQSEGLALLLRTIRTHRPSLGVIVYTGYTYEVLQADSAAQALLAQTDLLIDGQYRPELDDGNAMRGSSNQRLLYLTERYRNVQMPQYRSSELRFADGFMRLIGIPSGAAREALTLFTNGGSL